PAGAGRCDRAPRHAARGRSRPAPGRRGRLRARGGRMSLALQAALAEAPVIAILRGLEPADARAVGAALADAGVRAIEVPLNSPEPLESIRVLVAAFADRAAVGAGTVLHTDELDAVAAAGGRFIVAP